MSTDPSYAEYREAWKKLSPTQRARVMLKQQWEQASRLAVFRDWPSLFDPDREQDADELAACNELIGQRPELFPIGA
jgi:hypothetical protein